MPSVEEAMRAANEGHADAKQDQSWDEAKDPHIRPDGTSDPFTQWDRGPNTATETPPVDASPADKAGPKQVEGLTSLSSMRKVTINIVECNGGGFIVIEDDILSAHTSLAQALQFIGNKTTQKFGGGAGQQPYSFQSAAEPEYPRAVSAAYEGFRGRAEPAILRAWDDAKVAVKRFPTAFMAGMGVALAAGIGFLAVHHFA